MSPSTEGSPGYVRVDLVWGRGVTGPIPTSPYWTSPGRPSPEYEYGPLHTVTSIPGAPRHLPLPSRERDPVRTHTLDYVQCRTLTSKVDPDWLSEHT